MQSPKFNEAGWRPRPETNEGGCGGVHMFVGERHISFEAAQKIED